MFLLGNGNKGFWFYRSWNPIVERLKGEIIRLKSKITSKIFKISKISNVSVKSKITVIIYRISKLKLIEKLKTLLGMERITLNSRINIKKILVSKIINKLSIKSLTNINFKIKSKITKIFHTFTKIKKDEQ